MREELLDAEVRVTAAKSEADQAREAGRKLDLEVKRLLDQAGDLDAASQRHQAAEETASAAQRESLALRQQAQEAEGRILRALPKLDSTLEFLSDRLPEEGRVPPPVGAGALEKIEAVAAALPALRAAFREVDGQSLSLRQELRMAEAKAQLSPLVVQAAPRPQPTPDGTFSLSNKKDEDSLDIEAAMLSGGAGGFQPIAGLMRGAPRALQLPPCVNLAEMADSWTVIMHTKPQLRLALILYLTLLHALFLGAVVL